MPSPPYAPFPTDLMPDPVGRYVREASAAIGCDPSFVALPLLSALAGAIGNSRRIRLKRTWREPAVIWTAVVGESGSHKSPGVDAALSLLRRRQARAMDEFAAQERSFDEARLRYKAQLARWRKGPEGQLPEHPKAPRVPRLLCSDVTVPAIAALLHQQPRGLLLARDELAGWLRSVDASRDVEHWLELHRAGPLIVDRKSGQRTIHVSRAAVSITGGIQPVTLREALGRRHFDNGLAARLLLAMPPRRVKRWSEAQVSPARVRIGGRPRTNMPVRRSHLSGVGSTCHHRWRGGEHGRAETRSPRRRPRRERAY